MNTQLKSIAITNPSEAAQELFSAFKETYGNYKPIDAAVRVVTAYYRGECDDLDFVMQKMSNVYHTETAARAISHRANKKGSDYAFKRGKAVALAQIINHLEACIK